LFGISDLTRLAKAGTHKFEARYMDKLVGGSVDEIPEVYAERSAVNNAQNIRSPLLVSELDQHRLYFVVGAAGMLDSY
jgi:hypothetical protein